MDDTSHLPAARNERPRDRFGRPLPWGATTQIHLLDYDALPVDQNHRIALDYLADEQFFSAHEAWESAWRQSKGGSDEEFFKGLSQIGAGYTHYLRGNPVGTVTLLTRGISRITPYGPVHHSVDIAALAASATRAVTLLTGVTRSHPLPEIEFPRKITAG